jgi:hypothetical protein
MFTNEQATRAGNRTHDPTASHMTTSSVDVCLQSEELVHENRPEQRPLDALKVKEWLSVAVHPL